VFVLDLVFGLFASMIAMWFSRHREFRADAGGAALAGTPEDDRGARAPAQNHGQSTLPKQIAAFGIRRRGHGLRKLLMSHPPLEERIAALRNVADGECRQRRSPPQGGLRALACESVDSEH
jgi:heat shock protein HtpX